MAQIPFNGWVGLQGNCQLLFGQPAREPAQLNPLEQEQSVERKVGHVDPIDSHISLFKIQVEGLRGFCMI